MLKIYNIDSEYIDYLKQFEQNIDYNIKDENKHKRPYVGIVFEIDSYLYFAPLKSPKKKYNLNMKSHTDIILIDDGKMGIINLNDMIPVPKAMKDKLLTEVEYKTNVNDGKEIVKYKT